MASKTPSDRRGFRQAQDEGTRFSPFLNVSAQVSELEDSWSFVAHMLYAFPILIALMLTYMFWLAAFRLRRDRLAVARLTRRPKRAQRRRALS
jgi:hypothetical protein